jgi:hypothetical protein
MPLTMQEIFQFAKTARLLQQERKKIVRLKEEVVHTHYLFGTIDELKASTLYLIEQNDRGDCLCSVNEAQLVDVDHRDIAEVIDKDKLSEQVLTKEMKDWFGQGEYDIDSMLDCGAVTAGQIIEMWNIEMWNREQAKLSEEEPTV